MLTLDRAFGALVLIKAVDVVLRGPQALPPAAWAAALGLWILGGAGLLRGLDTHRCMAAVAIAGAAIAVDFPLELRRQHLVLLLGVAVVGVVARNAAERILLLRVQLTALYGVAALSKLNESYLGGTPLAAATAGGPLGTGLPPLPLVLAASLVLVAVEVLLAVTPWVARLRVAGTAVAAALHGLALLLVTGGPLVTLRLLVFGGTAVALHAASAGLLQTERVRPSAPVPR